MACMSPEGLIPSLKIDLGITTDAYNERLADQIAGAIQEITAMGASLDGSPRDRNLVLMYAAWRWRSRAEQTPMGRMLQLALNNRILGEAASADG